MPIGVLCDWKDISIAHVIIIIKSEVPTFPIVIIFFRGCVPEMFVTSYSVTYCIYVPGKPGICFRRYCAVYDECKYSDSFWLADRIRLFVQSVHHLIIIIVQTYLKALNIQNTCQIYFVECVSKIKHILSLIHYTICGAVCFQFTHFSCDDWDNIYILCLIIIIKSEVWTITHFFRVRSWNNGVRCMSFYILIHPWLKATFKFSNLM